jgi:hypothetical protein
VHLRPEGGRVDEQAQPAVPRPAPSPASCRRPGGAGRSRSGGGPSAISALRGCRSAATRPACPRSVTPTAGAAGRRRATRRPAAGPAVASSTDATPARRAAPVVHQEDRLQVGVDGGVEREPVADRDRPSCSRAADDPSSGGVRASAPSRPAGRGRPVRPARRRRAPASWSGTSTPPPARRERRGGPGVAVLPRLGVVPWEDEPHDVVLVARLERDHPVGVDDVVRRGGQRGQASGARRVVPQRSEGRPDQPARAGTEDLPTGLGPLWWVPVLMR